MSSIGEYFDVWKESEGVYVAIYDQEQRLHGPSFNTEQEAWDFVNKDTHKSIATDTLKSIELPEEQQSMRTHQDATFVDGYNTAIEEVREIISNKVKELEKG